MKKIFLTLPAVALLTMGCGHGLMQPQAASDSEIVAVEADRDEPVDLRVSAADPGDPEARFSREPQVGDFVVFRFSGSYRSQPLMMTQRVVARPKRDQLVMDVELDDGESAVRLRLRLRNVSGARGELASVARIDDHGVQLPFGVAGSGCGQGGERRALNPGYIPPARVAFATVCPIFAGVTVAYEQLMAQTMLGVQSNDMRLGFSDETVHVGEWSLPAIKTTYRVSVSGGEATMETYESERFPWGDVGGKIVAADGTVLYRAEVLKVGGRDLSRPRQIAIQATEEASNDEFE